MGLAAPYLVAVLLYLSRLDPDRWLGLPPWGVVAGKAVLALVGPLALAVAWLRLQPSRRAIWVFDWIGGGMIAYAAGWLGAIGRDLIAPDRTGRWLLVGGAALWMLSGTAILVLGAVALTRLIQSERSERQRLESLMRFTRQIASLDFQSTLDAAARELYDLLHADACVIFLWNEQEQVLVPVAGVHSEAVYTKDYIERVMSFRCPKGYGLTGVVMETGQPHLSSDVRADPRTASVPGYEADPKSSIVAPLILEGRSTGVVRITRRGLDQFTQEDLDLALSFGGQAALMIEHGRVLQELSTLSMTDALTGLLNARQFHRTLEREAPLAERHEQPLSLVVIDSDSLRQLNDRMGHQTGDLHLKQIARVIRETIRRTDFAARYAGDQFLILLSQTDSEAALQIAERIRLGVERTRTAQEIPNTVSIGVATLPAQASTAEGLITAAMEALSRSKDLGKNRTSLASSRG